VNGPLFPHFVRLVRPTLRTTYEPIVLRNRLPVQEWLSLVIDDIPYACTAAFIMDVYSHIIGGMQSDAMASLDDVLPVAKRVYLKELTPTLHVMSSRN